MKRLIGIVLVFFLCGIGIALAGGKPEAKEFEVAVSFPGSVEFFKAQKQGMDKAALEFGLKLIYSDAEWDAGKQLSQIENFVARKVDLILLCAADNQALLPAVKTCNDAKVPLITFTNAVGPNPDGTYEGIISYIGTNEVTVGRLLGKMAEKFLDNKPSNIVLIEGTPGTPPQRQRTQGFKEIADKHPEWKIVFSQAIPGWTKEGALAAMEAFLQTGQKVDLITTHYAGFAVAAATALEEKGYQGKVYITGVDFNKEVIPYIKSGKIDGLSAYGIADSGYKAVEAAAKYLKGEKLPRVIEIQPTIVSKENVDTFPAEL